MMRLSFGVACFIALLASAMAIKCKLCWPAMDKTKCRESEKKINCASSKGAKYDACIEVVYHANHTVVRTCYQGWKCEGARLHCTKYGPCEVRCCKKNYCNPAPAITVSSLVIAIVTTATSYYVTWH